MPEDNVRIILADDHEVVLQGLRALLDRVPGFHVAGVASSGREAIELTKHVRPDIVVMDVTMPDLDGIAATKRILKDSSSVKVLALSMHTSSDVANNMFEAGASGYVIKSSSGHEIIDAIRAVIAGETYMSEEIRKKLTERDIRSTATTEGTSNELTGREREVVRLVAEGLSSKEIGAQLHISVRTVNWHRLCIMDKLKIRTVAEITKYAIREGLTALDS